MSDLIQGQAQLKSYIQKALTDYSSAGRRIHIAVVSAVHHAAMFGDASLLNFVFNGLRQNDQGAVKLFVRRSHAIIGLEGGNPDKKPTEVVQAAIMAGAVLDFKGGNFIIVKGHTSNEAKYLAKLCETRFINPDGEVDKFILDRNNFTETKVLGDADMLKSIMALNKRLSSTSETTKIKTSNAVRDLIASFADKAETMLGQLNLGVTGSDTLVAKPERKPRTKSNKSAPKADVVVTA